MTKADEARRLLTASSQISRSSYIEDVGGFRLDWYWKQSKHPTRVGVEVENGTVSSLSFGFPASIMRLQDITDLFGVPDEFSIRRVEAADATYLEYIVYYTSAKEVVFATTTNKNGSSASDSVDILYLNIDPDGTNVPTWLLRHRDLRQPWLGFGHLEDYLNNRPSH
jgi:hypothetical protein